MPHDKVETAVLTTEKRHQLAYCHVPKVASTSWMLTFAEMNHLKNNETENLTKKLSLHGMLMTNFSTLVSTPKEIEDINSSRLYKFVFLRHPFERLISAYHDKFVYTKQAEMMVPFVRHQIVKYIFKNLKKQENLKKLNLPFDIDMSFENFIDFVLQEASYAIISEQSKHWWPFSDSCKLCKIQYNFVGHLESLEEDVTCMLSRFVDYKLLHKMKDRTKTKVNDAGGRHTKEMSMQYFSKLSKDTILKLYELYKLDFMLGGYEFPQAYIDIGIS